MDRLDKWERREQSLDDKMISIFEKRMDAVKKAAEYKKRRRIKTGGRDYGYAPEKAAGASCNTDITIYIEGLLLYLLSAAGKYEKKIMSRK